MAPSLGRVASTIAANENHSLANAAQSAELASATSRLAASRRITYTFPPLSHYDDEDEGDDNGGAGTSSLPTLRIPRPKSPRPRTSFPHYHIQPASSTSSNRSRSKSKHPRHSLPVSSLAIDASTSVTSDDRSDAGCQPRGILYTGGRDGLVGAWELDLPFRRRSSRRKWEEESHFGSQVLQDGDGDDDETEALLETRTRAYASAAHRAQTQIADPGSLLPSESETLDQSEHSSISAESDLPYEQRWEVDPKQVRRPARTSFRQCVQPHTDWVNDIVLCNRNQTCECDQLEESVPTSSMPDHPLSACHSSVISASSDRTVKLWNPHDKQSSLEPHVLGTHKDYVKCLAYARDAGWVASGSFDRTIKLWDVRETRSTPVVDFGAAAVQASVYAIASSSDGSVIAGGSPERVVRLFDSRTGTQSAQLVGHTDNIRAVLVSEDGRHLLSASSDATIRLWSTAEQRCLHTFSHHTSSVWSLFSSNPNLDIFYSGDRDGLVCKVDWARCAEVAEGECVVLAHDTSSADDGGSSAGRGIHKIVALDNAYVWTATGSSSVNKWYDVPARTEREVLYPIGSAPQSAPADDGGSDFVSHAPSPLAQEITSSVGSLSQASTEEDVVQASLFGIPFESLVSLAPTDDPYADRLADLYSTASHLSYGAMRGNAAGSYESRLAINGVVPAYEPAGGAPSHHASSPLRPAASHRPSSIRFAASASPNHIGPDGERNSTQVEDEIAPDDEEAHAARLAYEARDVAEEAVPLRSKPIDTITGTHGLLRSSLLNDRRHALTIDSAGSVALWDIILARCVGIFSAEDVAKIALEGKLILSASERSSPGDVLELVKEQIEGEGTAGNWCTVDTRFGALSVHLDDPRCFDAEIYLDECGFPADEASGIKPDQRVNIGRWVLRNLFQGFVRAEMMLRDGQLAALPPRVLAVERQDVLAKKRAPLLRLNIDSLEKTPTFDDLPHTPGATVSLAASAKTPAILGPDIRPLTPSVQPALTGLVSLVHSTNPTPAKGDASSDYFSRAVAASAAQTPGANGGKQRIPSAASSTEAVNTPSIVSPTPQTPGGGFMGRFRAALKSPKPDKAADKLAMKDSSSLNVFAKPEETPQIATLRQVLSNSPLSPPSTSDFPTITFPASTAIVISSSLPSQDAASWEVLYRGLVRSIPADVGALELCLPAWLVEWLLFARQTSTLGTKEKEQVKLGFTMHPWHEPDSSSQPDGFGGFGSGRQPLPELPNGNARLTATRMLRIHKASSYVYERLEMQPPRNSRLSSIALQGPGTMTPMALTPLSSGTPTPGGGGAHSGSLDGISARLATVAATSEAPNHSSAAATGGHDAEASPSDLIEMLCNNQPVPPHATLAQVQRFWWKSLDSMRLEYRWRDEGTRVEMLQGAEGGITTPDAGKGMGGMGTGVNGKTKVGS